MSGARTHSGFRLTARDREMVRWIGRLRMATAAQVAERFDLGRAVGYARLSGLVRLGLLEHARIFHASPGVYLAPVPACPWWAAPSLPHTSICAPTRTTSSSAGW